MRTKKDLFCFVLLLFLCLGYGARLDAVIYEIPAVGPKSSGMIGSVAATADDLIDAIYVNPAALSLVAGSNVTAGAGIASWPLEYEHPNGYKDTSNTRPILPYCGFSTDRSFPFFWGIGVFSNFGAGFDFEKDPSHGIFGDMTSLIGVLSINPTLAYQITPVLALGIQANIGYGKAEINFPISTDALETDSDGFGFGVSLGLLYKPIPQLNIGLKWRSPLQFTLKGDAEISNNTGDDLKLFLYYPQAISIGFGYRPIDNLTVELDFIWYHWSHFGHSRFSYDNWHSLDGPLSRGMKDCYRISIGIEYLLKDNIALWTGYLYNVAATKKEWISPLAPDITNHNFGLGGGFEIGDFQIDLSWIYTYIPQKRLSSSKSKSGFPGKYSSMFFDTIIGITYRF